MKISHYCYTRGCNGDYRRFSYPRGLSKKSRVNLKNIALSILGDDVNVNRDLNIPKWILVKERDFVAWGVCCYNKLLANEKFTDKQNRLIRGFFAVVITDCNNSEIQLPYDLEYFKQLYALEVEPYWNQYKPHACKTDDFLTGDYKYIHAESNEFARDLNTDIFKCKSLGNIDKEKVLAVALSLDHVSLLIDNDNIYQATNRVMFMNCLSEKVMAREYLVKQQCPKCKKNVSSFVAGEICADCKQKEEENKVDIVTRKTEETDSENKKVQLERKIEEIKKEGEYKDNLIKKKDRIIKSLMAITVVLLLFLSYYVSESGLPKMNKTNSKEETSPQGDTVAQTEQNLNTSQSNKDKTSELPSGYSEKASTHKQENDTPQPQNAEQESIDLNGYGKGGSTTPEDKIVMYVTQNKVQK